MKLLLDTCVLIWFLRNNKKKLSDKLMTRIEDPENEVYLSVASFWEMAIKSSLGKLALPQALDDSFKDKILEQGFEILDINFNHVTQVQHLPTIHTDPFDRLMISQCKTESLTAVTNDEHWSDPGYGIKTLWT